MHMRGRGFAPDHTGKLTEIPHPLAGFQVSASRQRREDRGEGTEGGKWEG